MISLDNLNANGTARSESVRNNPYGDKNSPQLLYGHTDNIFNQESDQTWLLRIALESPIMMHGKAHGHATTDHDDKIERSPTTFKEIYGFWLKYLNTTINPSKDDFYRLCLDGPSFALRRAEQRTVASNFCNHPDVQIHDSTQQAWVLYIVINSDSHNSVGALKKVWDDCGKNADAFFSLDTFKRCKMSIKVDLSSPPISPGDTTNTSDASFIAERFIRTTSTPDPYLGYVIPQMDIASIRSTLNLPKYPFELIFLQALPEMVRLNLTDETITQADMQFLLITCLKYIQATGIPFQFDTLLSAENFCTITGFTTQSLGVFEPILSMYRQHLVAHNSEDASRVGYSHLFLLWTEDLHSNQLLAQSLSQGLIDTPLYTNIPTNVSAPVALRLRAHRARAELQIKPHTTEEEFFDVTAKLFTVYIHINKDELSTFITPDSIRARLLQPFLEPANELVHSHSTAQYHDSIIPQSFPLEEVASLLDALINAIHTAEPEDHYIVIEKFWNQVEMLAHPATSEPTLGERVRLVVQAQQLSRTESQLLDYEQKKQLISLEPMQSSFYTVRNNRAREGGIYLKVAADEKITTISLHGTADHTVYNPGHYDRVSLQPNTLLYATAKGGETSIILIKSISANNEVVYEHKVPTEDTPLNIVESQMYQHIIACAEADGNLETPDYLIKLWAASHAFSLGPNAAPRLHELEQAIKENERLQRTDDGKVLFAEWIDILRASARPGWVTTTAEQQLLLRKIQRSNGREPLRDIPKRQVWKRVAVQAFEGVSTKFSFLKRRQSIPNTKELDEYAPELDFAEAQYLFSLLYDRQRFVAAVQESKSFTPEEKLLFQTDAVYSTNAISIWSLSESLLSGITESNQKRTAHEKLTQYLYRVQAGIVPVPIDRAALIDELRTLLTDSQMVAVLAVLEKPLVFEIIMSRVADTHQQLYAATVAEIAKAISTNEDCTSTNGHREQNDLQRAGRPIDTLGYDPAQKTIDLKLTLKRIMGSDNPVFILLQGTMQSFDVPLPLSLPLREEKQPELIGIIEFMYGNRTDISQAELENSLASWMFSNELQESDVNTPNSDIDQFLDSLPALAFPSLDGSKPAPELTIAARSILVQLHLQYAAMQEEGIEIANDLLNPQLAREILAGISELSEMNETSQLSENAISQYFHTYIRPPVQRQLVLKMFSLPGSKAKLNSLFRTMFLKHMNPTLPKGDLPVAVSHDLQVLFNALMMEKKQGLAAKAIEKLGLDAVIALLLFHGWGGTGHVFDKIIQQLLEQIDPAKSAIVIKPSIMGSENSASIPHGSGRLLNTVSTTQDYQSTSAGLQALHEILGLRSKDTVIGGHSMGGLLMMYLALFLPPEQWERIRITALEPVSQNNDSVTNYIEFLRIMLSNGQDEVLTQSSKDAELLHALIADSANVVVNGTIQLAPLQRYLKQLPENAFKAINTHIKLLGYDKEGTFMQAIAALLNTLTTDNDRLKPILVTQAQDLLTWVGNVGINALCLETFVKNIPKDIAEVHGYELFANRDSFLALVTRMLKNTRDLTDEELEYLANLPGSYLQILLGVSDDVLKYQPTVVKWQVLIDRMQFAVVLANHYAHTGGDGLKILSNMIKKSIGELTADLSMSPQVPTDTLAPTTT